MNLVQLFYLKDFKMLTLSITHWLTNHSSNLFVSPNITIQRSWSSLFKIQQICFDKFLKRDIVKSLNNKNFKGKIKNCFVVKKIFKKRIFKRRDFFFF